MSKARSSQKNTDFSIEKINKNHLAAVKIFSDLELFHKKRKSFKDKFLDIFNGNKKGNESPFKCNGIIGNLEHYQKMKHKENFFSVGFWGFVKLLFKHKKFKLTNVERLFMKGEEQIAEEMDLLKILKKLQDIDKLKRILLSEDQLYFFNLLSKPMIILENQINKVKKEKVLDERFKFAVNEKPILGKGKLMELYDDMRRRSEGSHIDKRILRLLDDDVNSFLKNGKFQE